MAVSATAVTVADGGGKVDLGWTAPAFNGGSTITAYYYRFKEDTASNYPSSWTPAGQMEDGSGPNTTIQVETGLTPGKTYTFQVIAENGVGRGDPAESAEVTVLSTPPVDAPVIRVTVAEETDGGDDQIRINWDALGSTDDGDGDNTTNIISGYTLQWKSSRDANTEADPDTTEWPDDDAAATEDQVVGFAATDDDSGLFGHVHNTIAADTPLLPGTTYTYRVRALNDDGGVRGGPWSAEKSYTTPANTPSTPAAPGGEGVDSDSIKIDWEAPDNDGGADITSYELQVRSGDPMFTIDQNGDTVENTGNSTITNLPVTRTEHTQDGVRDGVDYYYRVRAVNSAGKGPWSTANATALTTASAAPGTPAIITNLDATNESQSAGSVDLTWTAPDQGALPISSFDIQIQRVDDNDVEADNDADIADWSDAVTVQPTPPTMNAYTHENAAGDATYHYRVRAVNGRGPGDWSTTTVMQAFDARDPAAPVLTAIATGANDVLLEWNVPQSNGATINGFQLQRLNTVPETDVWENVGTDIDDQTTGDQIVGPSVTLYTDSELVAGTKYDYRIRALPQPGAEDGYSETASATTPTGLPGRPVEFREPGADDPADEDEVGEITLLWDAPPDGGSKITGYELQVLDISTRTWVAEETLGALAESYTDEDLEPGKTYYYNLRAVSGEGPGPWTPFLAATAEIGVPDAPVLTATAASRRAIDLTWTVPDDNGRPITGYEIQRWNPTANSDAGMFTAPNLLTGRVNELVNEFTDAPTGGDELAPGSEHFYRIRALTGNDEDLQGAWSAEDADSRAGAASATTLGDVPAVILQSSFSAAAGSGTVDPDSAVLEWDEPTDAGGSDITGYSVQRYNGDTGMWDVIATPTASEYTDRGLTRGTTYYYRVAAVNAQGTGPYTEYEDAAITLASPDMPVLVATATGPRSIRLTWNIPDDNGTTITGFEIQKWGDTDDDPQVIDLDWENFGVDLDGDAAGHQSTTATQTFYIDSDPDAPLSPNTRYDYRIRATPATANDPYALANATTHAGAPGRPQNVSATADGETALKLEWDEPLTNNGSPIDRYEIWMWDRTAKQWGWNGVAGAVHTVSHPVTTFTHSPLDAGTQNIYRVRAVNDATNDNNGIGQWSTIFTGTTDE